MTARALDYMLVHSPISGSLDMLQAAWRYAQISVVLPSMAGFAAAPSLGNKVRGALGSVLLEAASARVQARQPCNWSYTSTAEFFFGQRPLLRLGDHESQISPPFVFEFAARTDAALLVKLCLFGSACERASSVADALAASLQHRVKWRDLAKDGPCFVPPKVQASAVEVKFCGWEPNGDKACDRVQLLFKSPLDAERGDGADNPKILLERLVRRVALIAPWFGVSLSQSYGALLEALDGVVVEAIETTSLPVPDAGGHRHYNQLSPPVHLHLSGNLEFIWPALVMGTQIHIGRGASLGLGRYELVPS